MTMGERRHKFRPRNPNLDLIVPASYGHCLILQGLMIDGDRPWDADLISTRIPSSDGTRCIQHGP